MDILKVRAQERAQERAQSRAQRGHSEGHTNEEAKKPKFKKDDVRDGGNVDNPTGSQHSPHPSTSSFSRKGKQQKQDASPFSSDSSRIERYIEIVQAFRYFNGEAITDKDRDGWLEHARRKYR